MRNIIRFCENSMQRSVTTLCCLIAMACASTLGAADVDEAAALQRVRDKVDEISKDRSEAETRKELAAWKQREPNSPEPYIVAANYLLRRTIQPTQVTINSTTGKPARKKGKDNSGKFAVVDPKTGKTVGTIGEQAVGPKPDPQTVQKLQTEAAAELEQALKIAPNRLDIMLGRASILHDQGDWKTYRSQMEVARRQVATEPQKLSWLENKPVSEARQKVVLTLHSSVVESLREETPAGDKRGEDLATLGAKYFPDSVELITDCGTARAYAKDWAGAAKFYEHAAQLAPADSIVMINLARAYLNLGDIAKAEKAAKKVVELNDDERAVEDANQILSSLSKKAEKR